MGTPVKTGAVVAGKYRVDRILGEGGMGIVVAAYHLQLAQTVALKFLRAEAVANPEVLDRFMREARNAGCLRSEHAARIIDVDVLDDGTPYIVMEYLEGGDLASVLMQQRTLAVPVAVDFVLQACDAIAEAHAHGIIHRDLKPQNLFVTRRHDNTTLVKVLDFGISKSMMSGDFVATNSQTVMGSPSYMSPEQMRSSKFVDVRTDVWALGIILYQLVAGHVPWKAETLTELCLKIATDPPPPFPDAQMHGFEVIVWRCLEKNPRGRFSDVYELAVALSPFAPMHAQPLIGSIGRVLQRQIGDGDIVSMVVDDALRDRAERVHGTESKSTVELSTLRQATGQSVQRPAPRAGARKRVRAAAVFGVLVSMVVIAVALGLNRGSEPADKLTSSPQPGRPTTPPVPIVAAPLPSSHGEELTPRDPPSITTQPTLAEPSSASPNVEQRVRGHRRDESTVRRIRPKTDTSLSDMGPTKSPSAKSNHDVQAGSIALGGASPIESAGGSGPEAAMPSLQATATMPGGDSAFGDGSGNTMRHSTSSSQVTAAMPSDGVAGGSDMDMPPKSLDKITPSNPSAQSPSKLRVEIDHIGVIGSLTAGAIQRAIDRESPAINRCTPVSPVMAIAHFKIIETRRANEVTVNGASVAINRCIAAALTAIRTEQAPDIGDADITVRIAFVPTP